MDGAGWTVPTCVCTRNQVLLLNVAWTRHENILMGLVSHIYIYDDDMELEKSRVSRRYISCCWLAG